MRKVTKLPREEKWYSLFTAVRFWSEKHDRDDFNLPLQILRRLWYTAYEVRMMQFRPFIYDTAEQKVPVAVEPMAP